MLPSVVWDAMAAFHGAIRRTYDTLRTEYIEYYTKYSTSKWF